jgi:hypothetical protein
VAIPFQVIEKLGIVADRVLKSSPRARHSFILALWKMRSNGFLYKVDGKIDEGFWDRKSVEWRGEEQQVLSALQDLEHASDDRRLDAARTLELANVTYSLYVSRKPAEQGQLFKMVLSNCAVDGASLYPTYRLRDPFVGLDARLFSAPV